MKKVIIPIVLMAALLGHIAYNFLHADAFVFDAQQVVEEALVAADQKTTVPAMAVNYNQNVSPIVPDFSTTALLQPEGLPAFQY